LRLSEARGVRK